MSITVTMSDLLRNATGAQEPIELPASAPLECLQQLTAIYPILKKWLYNESGTIRPHIWLLVNDERIYEDSFTKPLGDGDQIFIMVAILGG